MSATLFHKESAREPHAGQLWSSHFSPGKGYIYYEFAILFFQVKANSLQVPEKFQCMYSLPEKNLSLFRISYPTDDRDYHYERFRSAPVGKEEIV